MKPISLQDLPRMLDRERRRVVERVARAVSRTADRGVRLIRRRVPVAFGNLRDSVHSTGTAIKVDAPHARAVEIGSPPHQPDMQKLIEWVKLRGMQGLTSRGRVSRRAAYQAKRVTQMIKGIEVRGGRGSGRHSPVDAPEKIAERIAAGIRERGTKPHWYMRGAVPEIERILDIEIKRALRKRS